MKSESVGNMISEWLDKNSTPEQQKARELAIENEIAGIQELVDAGYKFSTDKSYSLVLINQLGYYPIGICSMTCEETFIFETKEEASSAHLECQMNKKIADGWWYGKEEFLQYKPVYEGEVGYEIKVYWLENKIV